MVSGDSAVMVVLVIGFSWWEGKSQIPMCSPVTCPDRVGWTSSPPREAGGVQASAGFCGVGAAYSWHVWLESSICGLKLCLARLALSWAWGGQSGLLLGLSESVFLIPQLQDWDM